MDAGWIVVMVLAGMFLVVTRALCKAARNREEMEELWRHPPDRTDEEAQDED